MLACACILTWITFVLVGCAEWWGAQTGKLQSIHSRRNNFSGREGQYSPSSQSILAQFNSLPRVVWHTKLFSQCLWETENAPKKQDSGSQQLETDGSHKRLSLSNIPAAGSAEYHSELLCLWSQCLCWWPCSVSELMLFLRTKPICVELYWSRTGPSILYLSPCVL